MRRLRVTASQKKQLAGLRDAKGSMCRGGVMHLPRILPCEEWEALACVQQDALIAASYEDRADRSRLYPEPNVLGPDPADVSHRYKR
ncbi:MAG: hypothetical protein U1F08_12035 [Steroidobacteraceae bacterium]